MKKTEPEVVLARCAFVAKYNNPILIVSAAMLFFGQLVMHHAYEIVGGILWGIWFVSAAIMIIIIYYQRKALKELR